MNNILSPDKNSYILKKYHTSSSQVGKVAHITQSKKLILTHFVPTRFNIPRLKKIVRKDFGKDPVIGKDLLKINI